LGRIVNGFTGFNFSSEPHNNVYYGAVVAVVLVVVLALLGWKRWTNKRAKRDRTSSDGWLHDSYVMN
jgi:membrane protein DedA with SNARE-associated domain